MLEGAVDVLDALLGAAEACRRAGEAEAEAGGEEVAAELDVVDVFDEVAGGHRRRG
jgi:hypothetical protein